MELIPNCSELVCRIDLKNISDLKNAGLQVTKIGSKYDIYDKENNTTITVFKDEDYPNTYTAETGDCDHEDFPTMEKISKISGKHVSGGDGGGGTTYFDEFVNNKVTKLNMTQTESDKLMSYLVLDSLNSNNLKTNLFTKYINLPVGEQMNMQQREAQLLKKNLSLIFPALPQKELLGKDYNENLEDDDE